MPPQPTAIHLDDVRSLNAIREMLKELYKQIPSTKGCMENINKDPEHGGCGAWCCATQNPQVLYSEYLNSWRHVNERWDAESLLNLIADSLRNYLNNGVRKGCVFWDKKTKLCTQHDVRPLACRTYGVMPSEEWRPRYERLKVMYPNEQFRHQCKLVSLEKEGGKLKKADTDHYWKQLVRIEKAVGIPERRINDAPGGTYRTYHDHIVMSMWGQNIKIMAELTRMRLNGTEEEKERFVRTLIHLLRASKAEAAKVSEVTGGNVVVATAAPTTDTAPAAAEATPAAESATIATIATIADAPADDPVQPTGGVQDGGVQAGEQQDGNGENPPSVV